MLIMEKDKQKEKQFKTIKTPLTLKLKLQIAWSVFFQTPFKDWDGASHQNPFPCGKSWGWDVPAHLELNVT